MQLLLPVCRLQVSLQDTGHEYVAFLELNVVATAVIYALVMVVDRNGQRYLCAFLSDDVLVEYGLYPMRGRKTFGLGEFGFMLVHVVSVVEQVHAKLHAFVADIRAGSRDYSLDLILVLSAKGAANKFLFFAH